MQKMKRTAIYARFSSDRQNERSCQDQIDLCRSWAESRGFTIVETFQDNAVSGASMVNRPGLGGMLYAAQKHDFDIVVCEALDRLSRDQADLGQIRKQLAFHDISIHTVQDGEVGTIHVGIKGLMGELYLADLAQKTKRGLRAVVNQGRQAGGKSYGYDSLPGKAGELIINDDEAETIRRIFEEYATGKTPREIARDLNADGIPSPRGGKWNASTINGSRSRQNGILQNRLYIGQIVWNRQRFIKNPDTGKRVSRLNPESEWIINDAPHLRLIEDELYQQVSVSKADRSRAPAHKSKRAKHVFSGLIKCGCCGASYTVFSTDRLMCAGNRERGDCDNKRTITRQHIERRVLAALHEHLADPDLIAEYVRAYHDERKKLQRENRTNTQQKQKRINALKAEIDRGVDLLLKGRAPDSLMDKINEMEDEKKVLESELEAHNRENVAVEIHPAAAEKFRKIVAGLHQHLEDMKNDAARDEIFAEIRKLVDKIVITPTPGKQPVGIDVHGQLAALLKIRNDPQCMGSMVAGARNDLTHTYKYMA